VTGQDACVTTSRRLLVGVLAGVLAAVCAAPVPAAADVRRFRDRVHDTAAPADITRVAVDDGPRLVVTVRHRNLGFGPRAPRALRVDLDTGPRFAGPEFFLRVVYQSDAAPELRLARGWDHVDGARTSCTGERVTVSTARDITRVSVPAACLRTPARVRVHVRLTARAGAAVDLAPGARTMGPWTHR
jgi:hypothetical protein